MMFTHFKKIYGVGLKNQITIILFQIGPTSHSFSEANPGGGGGGTWVFFGWVFAARDSKLAPRSKKKIPLKLIPRSRIRLKTDTPF